jgi:hypothetical protein
LANELNKQGFAVFTLDMQGTRPALGQVQKVVMITRPHTRAWFRLGEFRSRQVGWQARLRRAL